MFCRAQQIMKKIDQTFYERVNGVGKLSNSSGLLSFYLSPLASSSPSATARHLGALFIFSKHNMGINGGNGKETERAGRMSRASSKDRRLEAIAGENKTIQRPKGANTPALYIYTGDH